MRKAERPSLRSENENVNQENDMSFITIDDEKCNRCGICIAECPERVIEMASKESLPTVTEFGKDLCIECGHCVAVCPEEAFNLDIMTAEQCSLAQPELLITLEQMEQHIRFRRSIRTYKKKPVPRDILERLIDAARYAPTAKNLQPVHWLVIEDREEVNRLGSMVIDWMRSMLKGESEALFTEFMMSQIVGDWERGGDWICRGAPHMIVAHGPTDLPIPASESGCMIALTTLELAAPSFGLGACWGGYFNAAANNYPPLRQALDLPENHDPYGAMMIGYPTYEYHRIPLRKEPSITWR